MVLHCDAILITLSIWQHLHNLKNGKNTFKEECYLPATLLKVTLLLERFSCFLNCTNGTKSRKASQRMLMKPLQVCLSLYFLKKWILRKALGVLRIILYKTLFSASCQMHQGKRYTDESSDFAKTYSGKPEMGNLHW